MQSNKSFQIEIPVNEDHTSGKLQNTNWRKTQQFLIPAKKNKTEKGKYDIYPSFKIEDGKILNGISELVDKLVSYNSITIDGYVGVYWQILSNQLFEEFSQRNISVNIFDVKSAMKNDEEISSMIKNDLGKDDSIFGMRTNLKLADFFDEEKIKKFVPVKNVDINIILGCGSELTNWNGILVYVDLPKNELQFRMRAESITNLGSNSPFDSQQMYKRFYFIDWVVLNERKKNILNKINFIVDAQRPNTLLALTGEDFRKSLNQMSENYFRVRPWFEPGVWGGSWIKDNIHGLTKDVPNYAWSFELIVPENGIIIESDENLLEVSFDFLMFQENENILGKHAVIYENEFPIRFDFLDTFDGGNLSVQCHPRLDYIKNNFGENITQDESYYILDTKNNAKVYLGFQEEINSTEFRNELEQSFKSSNPIEIEKYVQTHEVKKHDLLLIPNGTIHGSGKNNLVLEISNTPYIFTFKMYDWVRLDLNGKPRPINIEHAFNNLYFDRKGEIVKDELIARSKIISEGKDWKIVHLQTHKDHIYDVERLEFFNSINVQTNESVNVCMLVEGESIILETENGMKTRFNYAETFVIPAAAKSYKLINESKSEAKVVKAFLK
ncbi:MAG: class I mannose-6-phosphate isomerase [Melioribacteraceae bacterium]